MFGRSFDVVDLGLVPSLFAPSTPAQSAMAEREFLDYLQSLSEPTATSTRSVCDFPGPVEPLGLMLAPRPSV